MTVSTASTSEEKLSAHAGSRLVLITESFQRLTGRQLVHHDADAGHALWTLPQVILAHGLGPDPVFFYANATALELFELTPEQLMSMPSRLSAEAMLREERAALLERVACDGFIDDYSGIRVSRTGRRFRIQQATVWDLIDEHGSKHGQAATFGQWQFL